MSEFGSWVKRRGKVYFVTGEQIASEKGQELIKLHDISPDDYCGHGTIRKWYGIDEGDGIDKECTDFSTPGNFPPEIVVAIKAGKMRGVGIGGELLTLVAWADFINTLRPVFYEYEKVRQIASDECNKVTQAAFDKYKKVSQAAFWDSFAILENRAKAWR